MLSFAISGSGRNVMMTLDESTESDEPKRLVALFRFCNILRGGIKLGKC
jgi:hypothetical protein